MPTTGAPLGETPLGYGEPEEAPVPPEVSTFSRFIDTGAGDFAMDDETRGLAQMPGVRQRVLLALKTRFGTSTVLPRFGLRWGGKLDAQAESRIKGEIRLCLKPLVEDGSISLVSIDWEKRDLGRAVATITYFDKTIGRIAPPIEVS